MLNKYFKMETDLIIYLPKNNTWIICHILCVKRYIYSNNNLFGTNLKRGARCSSVVRAFAHGAMGRRIDPSWGGPIELFLVPASAPRLV